LGVAEGVGAAFVIAGAFGVAEAVGVAMADGDGAAAVEAAEVADSPALHPVSSNDEMATKPQVFFMNVPSNSYASM
jgi:hypothetical protein